MILSGDSKDTRRVKIEGCLIEDKDAQPEGTIVHCGLCPNHTMMISDPKKNCVMLRQ